MFKEGDKIKLKDSEKSLYKNTSFISNDDIFTFKKYVGLDCGHLIIFENDVIMFLSHKFELYDILEQRRKKINILKENICSKKGML